MIPINKYERCLMERCEVLNVRIQANKTKDTYQWARELVALTWALNQLQRGGYQYGSREKTV